MDHMKKVIVSLAILFAFCHLSAQTVDSIPHHDLGPHSAQTSTFMEMSDSSLLGGIEMADEYSSSIVPLGYVLHKVSQNGSLLEVSDSLFMPYGDIPWHLTAKDPQGEGNILAEFCNDFGDGSCLMRIRRFDDNIVFDTAEVVVSLAHFNGSAGDPGLMLDPNGDIIIVYYNYYSTTLEPNFVRIGLDGAVKYQTSIGTTQLCPGRVLGPILFSESPLSYCIWGSDPTNFNLINCYVLDSLFNVTDSYTLPYYIVSPDCVGFFSNSYLTKLLGLEDGNFLVARSYYRPYNMLPHMEDDGILLMKYDGDYNLLATRKFLSEPYTQYPSAAARPIGLERSKDGHVYFAYFTHVAYHPSQVSVVKMDNDLNIVWQRHCLEREVGRDFGMMKVLDDNGVAVMGINTILTATGYVDYTEAFYVIVNNDYDALEEQGIIIRPYAYWPNPARDELHLQYSPDVTPQQIELYDLQGRMVRSQRNGLERIDLEGLAAGGYTMRVTLEGGKTFTDKVVKE